MTAPVTTEARSEATNGGLSATLPAILLQRAALTPRRTALRRKELGRWRQYSWAEYAARAAAIGEGLRTLGVERGDRVAIQSENRPAWLLADLGIQGIGAVTVGIYPTYPTSEVEYLLRHSSSVVLVVEDEEQLDKVAGLRHDLPFLHHIVVVDPRGVDMTGESLVSLADLEALGRGGGRFEAEVAATDPGDPALIVYTSGTTGPPKAAILSQHNLLVAAASFSDAFGLTEDDEILSYLPLCHVAERLMSVSLAVATGYVVNFGESAETFAADLQEVQPTVFVGVPRVWEKLIASTQIRMADAGWIKRRNYALWTRVGLGIARRRRRGGGRLRGRDAVLYGVGWLLLYRSLRQKLGLLRARSALSGAAPVSPRVLEFFWAVGVPVREGYGQTENTAQGTIVPADDVRIGTVGRPLPDCEIRIASDGEILTRGPGTFLGYLDDPAATAEAIDPDGWLHTGDVGELDGDGFLRITDRKKDIIITAGGKNVSPSEIENRLKVSSYVREAIVIGDRRKYLTALIGVELDTVSRWASDKGIPFTTYADLSAQDEVKDLIWTWVQGVNADLAQVETIKQIKLLPEELDEPGGGLTATQKVKRRSLAKLYAPLIEGMYP